MIPNAGHEALAGLALAFPQVRVITQNIDALVSALRVGVAFYEVFAGYGGVSSLCMY